MATSAAFNQTFGGGELYFGDQKLGLAKNIGLSFDQSKVEVQDESGKERSTVGEFITSLTWKMTFDLESIDTNALKLFFMSNATTKTVTSGGKLIDGTVTTSDTNTIIYKAGSVTTQEGILKFKSNYQSGLNMIALAPKAKITPTGNFNFQNFDNIGKMSFECLLQKSEYEAPDGVTYGDPLIYQELPA